MAKPRWPRTEEEFRAQQEAAEAKYRPLVRNLTGPELAGLSAVVKETLEIFNAELQAETDALMRERSPSIGRRSR